VAVPRRRPTRPYPRVVPGSRLFGGASPPGGAWLGATGPAHRRTGLLTSRTDGGRGAASVHPCIVRRNGLGPRRSRRTGNAFPSGRAGGSRVLHHRTGSLAPGRVFARTGGSRRGPRLARAASSTAIRVRAVRPDAARGLSPRSPSVGWGNCRSAVRRRGYRAATAPGRDRTDVGTGAARRLWPRSELWTERAQGAVRSTALRASGVVSGAVRPGIRTAVPRTAAGPSGPGRRRPGPAGWRPAGRPRRPPAGPRPRYGPRP
jgi:hypothetical protein